MSETSENPGDSNPRPSFWPARLPAIPARSPLRSRLNRPNAPPPLTRNFHATRQDVDLEYYFDESIHSPMTATTTSSSSSSSSSLHSLTFPASAPPCHSTFASADPSFNRWLVATIGHQRYLTSRRLATTTTPHAAMRSTEPDLPSPPVPPKDHNNTLSLQGGTHLHARSNSLEDYTDYLEQTSSPPLPPSSLSLCNSSGWSCVARRTARSP